MAETSANTDVALQARIRELAEEKNAIILAHNYQIGPVQDVADVLGDSLGLAQEAAEVEEADIIVFCGVHFMAETAAILSPGKRVLLPDLQAGCFLADTLTAEGLAEWKAEHPGAKVVSYVNSTAAVKALSDYCCTSANAVKVVEAIPADTDILFCPDMFLGAYVREVTGRDNIHLWPGECHVHSPITLEMVLEKMAEYPEADVMVHPECRCSAELAQMIEDGDERLDGRQVQVASTGGMVRQAQEGENEQYIVGTEKGINHRLAKENPGREFIPVSEKAICQYMKRITLEKVLHSLTEDVYQVTVDPETAAAARGAVDRMLEIT